jgi:hypothetical protein
MMRPSGGSGGFSGVPRNPTLYRASPASCARTSAVKTFLDSGTPSKILDPPLRPSPKPLTPPGPIKRKALSLLAGLKPKTYLLPQMAHDHNSFPYYSVCGHSCTTLQCTLETTHHWTHTYILAVNAVRTYVHNQYCMDSIAVTLCCHTFNKGRRWADLKPHPSGPITMLLLQQTYIPVRAGQYASRSIWCWCSTCWCSCFNDHTQVLRCTHYALWV